MKSIMDIRKLTLADLADCVHVDGWSAEPHAAWTLGDFSSFFDGRCRSGFAIWFHETMLGFVLYEADQAGRQLQLVRLGVALRWQRRHFGTLLLQHICRWLSPVPDVGVWMLVHERCFILQCFLRANGFRATRVYRGHCDGGTNDAYLFELQREQSVPRRRPLEERA